MWIKRLQSMGWSRLALAAFLILYGLVRILRVDNLIVVSLVPLVALAAGILLLLEAWPGRGM